MTNNTHPPRTAKRVYRWDDLPNETMGAVYTVTNEGQEPRDVFVHKNQQRMLEGLMRSPIYAASYCRLSDQVLPLRRDKGIEIRCDMYKSDPETGRERYGVYSLVSEVTRKEEEKVAA